jgi:hypothetical protein
MILLIVICWKNGVWYSGFRRITPKKLKMIPWMHYIAIFISWSKKNPQTQCQQLKIELIMIRYDPKTKTLLDWHLISIISLANSKNDNSNILGQLRKSKKIFELIDKHETIFWIKNALSNKNHFYCKINLSSISSDSVGQWIESNRCPILGSKVWGNYRTVSDRWTGTVMTQVTVKWDRSYGGYIILIVQLKLDGMNS